MISFNVSAWERKDFITIKQWCNINQSLYPVGHSCSWHCQSLNRSSCLFFSSHFHSSFRWTVTFPPLNINSLSAICPKVSNAKSMTASLNPHFPPNGIWGHINQTLLGYAHSHSDSSIRPRGSCHAPDWFLAFQWIDWEKET